MMSRLWTSMQRGEQSAIKTRWRRRHEQINRFHCAFKHYNCTFFIVVVCLPLTAAPPSNSLSLSGREKMISRNLSRWNEPLLKKEEEKPMRCRRKTASQREAEDWWHFISLSNYPTTSLHRLIVGSHPIDGGWLKLDEKQATREWSINYEKSPSWTKHNLVESTTWVAQIYFNIQASARDRLGRRRGRCRKLLREHKKASN